MCAFIEREGEKCEIQWGLTNLNTYYYIGHNIFYPLPQSYISGNEKKRGIGKKTDNRLLIALIGCTPMCT